MLPVTNAFHFDEPAYKAVQLLAKAILEEDNRGVLYKYVHQLHDIYAAVTGIKATHIPDEAIYLPQGKAIGPVGAAHCLLELQRTATFLKGIFKAITHLQKIFPEQNIQILYAGCGPYATLLTPIATLFPATAINFILLDINEISLSSAKKLFEKLGLTDHITRFEIADAATYTIKDADNVHMIISETMLNALRREPQVAIMQNLIPQMRDDAVFIPSKISVSAQLVSSKQEQQYFFSTDKTPQRLNIGELCTVDKAIESQSLESTITIPDDTGDMNELRLFTEITVFDDERLGGYDCSLTLPITLFELTDIHKGCKLHFRYAMRANPRFEYSLNGNRKFLKC